MTPEDVVGLVLKLDRASLKAGGGFPVNDRIMCDDDARKQAKDALLSAIRSVFAERDSWQRVAERCESESQALQARLDRYAWHDDDCDAIRRGGELRKPLVLCSCGFDPPIAQEQGK